MLPPTASFAVFGFFRSSPSLAVRVVPFVALALGQLLVHGDSQAGKLSQDVSQARRNFPKGNGFPFGRARRIQNVSVRAF